MGRALLRSSSLACCYNSHTHTAHTYLYNYMDMDMSFIVHIAGCARRLAALRAGSYAADLFGYNPGWVSRLYSLRTDHNFDICMRFFFVDERPKRLILLHTVILSAKPLHIPFGVVTHSCNLISHITLPHVDRVLIEVCRCC